MGSRPTVLDRKFPGAKLGTFVPGSENTGERKVHEPLKVYLRIREEEIAEDVADSCQRQISKQIKLTWSAVTGEVIRAASTHHNRNTR